MSERGPRRASRGASALCCLLAIVLVSSALGLRSMGLPKLHFGDGLDYLAAAYHLRHDLAFTQAATDGPAPPGGGGAPPDTGGLGGVVGVGGGVAGLEGVMFSAVPVLVAEQMPEGSAVRGPALAYVQAYEGRYGAGSRSLFGATLWDGFGMIEAAVPAALRTGPPGTPVFRAALRDAMEQEQGLALSEAVFSLSPADHSGAQADSQVMVEIRNGAYRLLKEP